MSCHGCATKFNLLTKEHGCPNCGYAYCSSCLKKKIVVPKLGTSLQKVCVSCFKSLESLKSNKPIPDRHETLCISRLESLDNPARPPITVYRQNPRMAQLKKGLSQEDQQIVDRLEKLKQDRKKSVPTEEEMNLRLAKLKDDESGPAPSEQEMQLRLAKLKGIDPQSATQLQKPAFTAPDTRTSVKKQEDLLNQLKEEAELDAKLPKAEEEIAARLAKLRGQDVPKTPDAAEPDQNDLNKCVHSSQPEDDSKKSLDEVNKVLNKIAEEANAEALKFIADLEKDEELRKRLEVIKKERKKKTAEGVEPQGEDSDEDNTHEALVEKALAELDIEKSLKESGPSTESKKSKKKKKTLPSKKESSSDEDGGSDDELPWCSICNEDASLRCKGCDGELYCKRCFREGHDALDMNDHVAEAFKASKV